MRSRRRSPQAAIAIHGHHHNLVLTGNTIGHTKPTVGILVRKVARNTKADANTFLNVDRELETEK
jgi:hypothetical protein